MKAMFQPDSCWLAVVDNQCLVLRVGPDGNHCLFPGEAMGQPLNRVQEWLAPVWTANMMRCSLCLKRAAEKLQTGSCLAIHKLPELLLPQSYWIGTISEQTGILQVVEDGVRVPGRQGMLPLNHVELWIMRVWGPELVYCPGCAQAKPRHDMVFLINGTPKGICRECSDSFDFNADDATFSKLNSVGSDRHASAFCHEKACRLYRTLSPGNRDTLESSRDAMM